MTFRVSDPTPVVASTEPTDHVAKGGDMSTMTRMTDPTDDVVDVDEVLASMVESGSCCAEVGLGGFLPSMPSESLDGE